MRSVPSPRKYPSLHFSTCLLAQGLCDALLPKSNNTTPPAEQQREYAQRGGPPRPVTAYDVRDVGPARVPDTLHSAKERVKGPRAAIPVRE